MRGAELSVILFLSFFCIFRFSKSDLQHLLGSLKEIKDKR